MTILLEPEILKLIAEIDEFKGRWKMESLAPEKLTTLRRIATIESVGSSTRIEGAKLSDREVERLLSGVKAKSFASRDEQEVAGYAQVMELVFRAWQDLAVTENHIRQLHRDLLAHSQKDEWHRGAYKTSPNNVVAFDDTGKQIGVVFKTASPFDTPRLMAELTEWIRTGRLKVDAKRCPNLVRESRLYRYDEDGSETPVDEENHALAALRYLIASLTPLAA